VGGLTYFWVSSKFYFETEKSMKDDLAKT